MTRSQKPEIETQLRRDVPVWLLDEQRIVQRANLLMLWMYGGLRIGTDYDPRMVIGRHAYASITQSIVDGRLALDDPGNHQFVELLVEAVIGRPDDDIPEVQQFLALVSRCVATRPLWQAAIAAQPGSADPFTLEASHARMFINHPGGICLQFEVEITCRPGEGPLITCEPILADPASVHAVESAYAQIRDIYPHVAYVQDAHELTRLAPGKGHHVTAAAINMTTEHESSSTPGEQTHEGLDTPGHQVLQDARPIPGECIAEWRLAQRFPRAEIDQAWQQSSVSLAPHPVYGPGFRWDLASASDTPTQVELFPTRSWATVRYLDGSLQQRERGLIVDYLALRTAQEGAILSLVSTREGRGTLINIYPSGEVDELLRLQPERSSLPSESLVFAAHASPPEPQFPVSSQPLLGVNEAAQQLGIGPEQIRALLRAQRLVGFKQDGVWQIPADTLKAYHAARNHRAEAPVDSKERATTYHHDYYQQRKQDPTWQERRRAQAREAMRRKRERERHPV